MVGLQTVDLSKSGAPAPAPTARKGEGSMPPVLIRKPGVAASIRALSKLLKVGLTDAVQIAIEHELERHVDGLPAADKLRGLREDAGLEGFIPSLSRAPALAGTARHKFVPGEVLADMMLGEDQGAYSREIYAARTARTGSHAVLRACTVLVARAQIRPANAVAAIGGLLKLSKITVEAMNDRVMVRAIELRQAGHDGAPSETAILDEAFRRSHSVTMDVMGHHPVFP